MPPCWRRRWTQPKTRTRLPRCSTAWRTLILVDASVGSSMTMAFASSSFLSSAARRASPSASSRLRSSSCLASLLRCCWNSLVAFFLADAVAAAYDPCFSPSAAAWRTQTLAVSLARAMKAPRTVL